MNPPTKHDQLVSQVLRDRYRIQSLLGRKTGRRTFLATDLETRFKGCTPAPVVLLG